MIQYQNLKKINPKIFCELVSSCLFILIFFLITSYQTGSSWPNYLKFLEVLWSLFTLYFAHLIPLPSKSSSLFCLLTFSCPIDSAQSLSILGNFLDLFFFPIPYSSLYKGSFISSLLFFFVSIAVNTYIFIIPNTHPCVNIIIDFYICVSPENIYSGSKFCTLPFFVLWFWSDKNSDENERWAYTFCLYL